jgi:hypothetical protein
VVQVVHTETAIEMRAELERILALAVDVERWPEILPHYRWVRLLDGGGDRKVVEMAARRGRIPVKWRAIQAVERDGPTPVIRFRHIWGVTRGMEVAWTFEPIAAGFRVRIGHDFSPPWPVIGALVADRIIGPQFVEYIARRTLATMKRIVEETDRRADGQAHRRTDAAMTEHTAPASG